MRRFYQQLFLAIAGSALLAGCGGGSNSSTEPVLYVYSARHYDTDTALYDSFTEKTGIPVQLVEGKDDELVARLKAEGVNSPADVFITVDAGRLWRADQDGLLQPVQSEVLTERIPENLRHPDGDWFGLTKRARILVYNKDKVKPEELSTYEDLAQPKWKGRVCVRSSSNVYNQSLIGSMIESRGIEATETWAKGLVANFARPPQGGDTDQIKAVAVGVCDVAIVNHYYVARMQQSDEPDTQEMASKVAIFFPNQQDRGTHVNISGAGVTANAPNREAAVQFIEHLTSPESQAVFAQGNDEYPVVADVAPPPELAQYGEFKADSINVNSYGKNSPEAVKLADRVGWK
ncbi:Fe(3+) ABC transporter substrate-binding protein [Lyngbya confervoides]|uniref:Fe(3+) ABC transporter substrate-binding protein n=1 Tax=Lyngbya confervoides BDU141951 TaxID=1574623 RepID=A0ABD4T0N1_9CYAN|nr:Fe(3+) ABC transporter substrate-binding protein [Lyngbya confervoides]MCM1981910.1 Fe(3+) ABC transporter substrate-binding protein [Lyngbya confervoides BDU141951]